MKERKNKEKVFKINEKNLTDFLGVKKFKFGELETAGYGTAVRIEQVLLLPVIGLNTAVLSIAGQNFGAKLHFRVKEVSSSNKKPSNSNRNG